MSGAVGMSFEIKSSTDRIRYQVVWFDLKDDPRPWVLVQYPRPSENWLKHEIYFADHDIDPAKIWQIRIGMNTLFDEVTYQFRNIKLIYKK